MPKLAPALSVATLKKLSQTPVELRPVERRDGLCRGLVARLEKSGRMTFHHAHKGGRRLLGVYPILTLAMARHAVQKGVTPEKKSALLFSDAVQQYEAWLNATKTPRQVKSNMTNLTEKVLGDLLTTPLSKLGSSTLDAWVGKRLQEVIKTTVKRNLNSVRAVCNRAVCLGLMQSNPMEGYTFKAPTVRRTRVLSLKRRLLS